METLRQTTSGMAARRVAAVAVAAIAGWGAVPAEASGADSEVPSDGTSQSAGAVEQWSGDQWHLRGRTLERREGWLVVEEARARMETSSGMDRAATERAWEVRADRLVARISRPGHIAAWWARGDVRIVGKPPVYATGSEAVSFRPSRSISLVGGPDPAEVLGEHWDLPGRRIAVDLRRGAATIFDVGRP